MTRDIDTLEAARQFTAKMLGNSHIDHDSIVIHDAYGQMDGHDVPREMAYFHVVEYKFKDGVTEVDLGLRYVMFGVESLPRTVKYVMVSKQGANTITPCFIAGGSRDYSPDPAYKLVKPMLCHATDGRRPLMWAAGRAIHLHVGERIYPAVPEAPTDIERTAMAMLGWVVYVDHLDCNGQECEYSGTSAGSLATVQPCPRCGERGVEPVLMPDGLAAGLATTPGAKDAARDILANAGMIP